MGGQDLTKLRKFTYREATSPDLLRLLRIMRFTHICYQFASYLGKFITVHLLPATEVLAYES